jgi:hypothetical protein
MAPVELQQSIIDTRLPEYLLWKFRRTNHWLWQRAINSVGETFISAHLDCTEVEAWPFLLTQALHSLHTLTRVISRPG